MSSSDSDSDYGNDKSKSNKGKIWTKIKGKLKREKKNRPNPYDHDYYSSRQERARSTSRFARFKEKSHERIKGFHEKVKERCKSLTSRKRSNSDGYSTYSHESEKKAKGKSKVSKLKEMLPRKESFSNFVKRIKPSTSKKKNIIVGGENDDFNGQIPNSPNKDYYPYSSSGDDELGDATLTSSNVWIYSVDASSGQTVYKNVYDNSRSFVKPRGDDVVLLDHKLLEQNLDRPKSVQVITTPVQTEKLATIEKAYTRDEELENFLTKINLIEKKDLFYEQHINYNMLSSLSEVHLADIGLKLGDRITVLNEIKRAFPTTIDFEDDAQETLSIKPESIYSEEEDDIVYNLYRGRAKSVPISEYLRERGVSPAALTELDAIEVGSSSATITALTNFVDKILNIKETKAVKTAENIAGDDTSIEISSHKSDYEADRLYQEKIRDQEKMRKNKLLEIMQKRNIKPLVETVKKDTVLIFELNEEPDEGEPYDLSFLVKEQEEVIPEIFFLEEAKMNDQDFSFILEEDRQFEFLNEDSGSEINVIDFEEDLDQQLYSLELEIATTQSILKAEGVLEINEIECEADKIEDNSAVERNTLEQTTCVFEESTVNDIAENEDSDAEAFSSSEESSIGRTRSKSFIKLLQGLSTDSGFNSIIENEANSRKVSLLKNSKNQKGITSVVDEHSCKVLNYVLTCS